MEAKIFSIGDSIALASILVTVWLARVGFYRAETRAMIDKAQGDINRVTDFVAEFWLSNKQDFSKEELQYWTHRLSATGDRVDLWVTTCANKLHIENNNALRDAIVELIDAATNDIESYSSIGPHSRKLRCTRVLSASTQILQIVESSFDRWPRKVLWW